jgi:hypothetical protein
MSILVILTNDSGELFEKNDLIEKERIYRLEIHCDRLVSDDRFFSNLFRLLVTIEQSSLANEDKFDALALVCLSFILFPNLSFFLQTLNLLINLVQNTKDVYKHLMEDNMPGGSSKKIYEYLAGVSSDIRTPFKFWRMFCRYFVNKNP